MSFRGIRTIKPLGYNETPMHGHYTTVLRKLSRSSPVPRKILRPGEHPGTSDDETTGNTCPCCQMVGYYSRLQKILQYKWLTAVSWLGGEWILLTLLGIVVALFSFIMDIIMEKCNMGRALILEVLSFSTPLQYISWTLFSVALVCFSTGFTYFVGPFAVGSGIPEVKTIMRGAPLYEYLTLRTLIAKIVGLSCALGSGLPIGKEGPFVHVASISATVLSKIFYCFKKESETTSAEILAAACAVGVACTFAAPIGGVLFSIEVTATYFAVKNYWRGFYSALVGAFFFRFLAIWSHEEVTLTAYFRTNLNRGTKLVPSEILPYSFVGVICGLGGVLFIYTHKMIVLFVRNNKTVQAIIKLNRMIYPSLVTFVVLSLFYPPGFGQYMGGMLTNPDAVRQLFSNNTWSKGEATNIEEQTLLTNWKGPLGNVYLTLTFFFCVRFWMCAVATTLPIPAGIFIPSFTLGAGLGRLIGEILAVWFPDGIGGNPILPGGYAIVGAAAFAGSVTHTVSTVVIAFEMTGQIGHVLPCIVAVLIACALSAKLSLSIFDVIVEIKKLPFLPESVKASPALHDVVAKDFMIKEVEFLTESTTYNEVSEILERHPYKTFPVIKSTDDTTLLGSVHRRDLEKLLQETLTLQGRKEVSIERQMQTNAETGNRPRSSTLDADDIQVPTTKDNDRIEEQMSSAVDFSRCTIDPAPFQIVDQTSLHKVHWLFSLLSLQHAFVTKDGCLEGIISVKQVLNALERAKSSSQVKPRALSALVADGCCCVQSNDNARRQDRQR